MWEYKKNSKKEIFYHLCCDEICQNYIIWMWHGEVDKKQIVKSQIHEVDIDMDDRLEDMIAHIGEDYFRKTHIL